jgi:hypothetical protein
MISNLSKVLIPNTLGKVTGILRTQNLEKNPNLCMITAKETSPTCGLKDVCRCLALARAIDRVMVLAENPFGLFANSTSSSRNSSNLETS